MIAQRTPLDDMSWEGLIFLLDRTDFSEPSMCGLGFATNLKEEIMRAAERKLGTDPIKRDILDRLQKSAKRVT